MGRPNHVKPQRTGTSRREFFKRSAGGAAMVVAATPLVPMGGLSAASADRSGASANTVFQHGVASGDPLQDRVIVKRVKEEEKTKGGIIIPDSAKEKPIEGEVLAVGNGKVQEDGKVRPLDVKVGDRVLFGKYSGTEVKIDGVDLLIMKESDIMGVLDK